MRLKDEQIGRLAENVLEKLAAAEVITLKKERGTVLTAIKTAISADIKAEETLERMRKSCWIRHWLQCAGRLVSTATVCCA